MSHRIYHTSGFVLAAYPRGEAGRVYRIYTQDFGLVLATVSGVRLPKSKLRLSLQNLDWLDISLVRGREFSHIISAERRPEFLLIKKSVSKLKFYVSILKLLGRLIHGEQAEPAIYQALDQAFLLAAAAETPVRLLRNLEVLLVFRLLRALGYIKDKVEYRSLFVTDDWSEATLAAAAGVQPVMIREINHTLKQLNV